MGRQGEQVILTAKSGLMAVPGDLWGSPAFGAIFGVLFSSSLQSFPIPALGLLDAFHAQEVTESGLCLTAPNALLSISLTSHTNPSPS